MVRDQEKSELTGMIYWKFQNGTFFFAHPLYSFPHSDITRVIPVKVKPFMAQQFLIPNVPKILACCIFLKFLNFLGF